MSIRSLWRDAAKRPWKQLKILPKCLMNSILLVWSSYRNGRYWRRQQLSTETRLRLARNLSAEAGLPWNAATGSLGMDFVKRRLKILNLLHWWIPLASSDMNGRACLTFGSTRPELVWDLSGQRLGRVVVKMIFHSFETQNSWRTLRLWARQRAGDVQSTFLSGESFLALERNSPCKQWRSQSADSYWSTTLTSMQTQRMQTVRTDCPCGSLLDLSCWRTTWNMNCEPSKQSAFEPKLWVFFIFATKLCKAVFMQGRSHTCQARSSFLPPSTCHVQGIGSHWPLQAMSRFAVHVGEAAQKDSTSSSADKKGKRVTLQIIPNMMQHDVAFFSKIPGTTSSLLSKRCLTRIRRVDRICKTSCRGYPKIDSYTLVMARVSHHEHTVLFTFCTCSGCGL